MAIQSKIFRTGDFAYQSWSRSYVLDLDLTEESTSVDSNTSHVTYKLTLRSGANNRFSDWPIYYAVMINGSVVDSGSPQISLPYNSSRVLASGTVAVPHEADGSKNLSVKANIHCKTNKPYLPPSMDIDELWRLTYIPRASAVSCTDGYIGSTGTITVYRNSDVFVHTLLASVEGLTWWVGSDGGYHEGPEYMSATNVPFHYSDVIYTKIPNSRYAEGLIQCNTYLASDHTLIGTTYANFTAMTREDRCAPTISGGVEDINPDTVALTGNSKKLIRYYSKAKCTASVATKNEASVSRTQVNGVMITSGFAEIDNVETGTFNFYVEDSRGYGGYDSEVLTLIPYRMLTNNAVAARKSPTSDVVDISFSGDYYAGSLGSVDNTLAVWYKLPSDQEYRVATITSISDGRYTATAQLTGLDYKKSHEILTVVIDKLGKAWRTLAVSEGIPVFNWGQDFFNVNGNFEVKGEFPSQYLYGRGNYQGNINELYESGVYRLDGYPASGNYGVLVVVNPNPTHGGSGFGAVLQIYADMNAGAMYRIWWYSSWSNWKNLSGAGPAYTLLNK